MSLILEDWRAVLPVFERVVVTNALALFASDYVEYTAYCDDFNDADFGTEPPLYTAVLEEKNGTTHRIKWEKLNE